MINKLKDILLHTAVKRLSKNKYFTEYFLIRNRQRLLEEVYEYPSIINNGYLHIERVISLAKRIVNMNGKVIIDAGAATGVISKMFAGKYPKSKIYSFEPIAVTFKELKYSTVNSKNIFPMNKALGAVSTHSTIHLLNRITSSSLLNASKHIEDPFFASALQKMSSEEVIVTTIDEEIPADENIGILKMDVQGFELEVMKGAINSLKRTDIILLEMQNHKFYDNAPSYFVLDEFLRENDFSLYDVIPSIREKDKLLEWDSIYVSNALSKTAS